MEGAGNESFSGHSAISETADGDFRLATDVAGMLVYRVLLPAVFGRCPAYFVVGSAVVGYLAHLPHPSQMDGYATHSSGSCRHHEC